MSICEPEGKQVICIPIGKETANKKLIFPNVKSSFLLFSRVHAFLTPFSSGFIEIQLTYNTV